MYKYMYFLTFLITHQKVIVKHLNLFNRKCTASFCKQTIMTLGSQAITNLTLNITSLSVLRKHLSMFLQHLTTLGPTTLETLG